MTEQPRGRTGERCKREGTYVSQAGARQFYAEGEAFGPCPNTGQETQWERTT